MASDNTFHPPLEQFLKIAPVIYEPKTDPRVAAILGAAYIENYLGEVIMTRMPGLNSDLRAKLFQPPGILAELGAKIDMARALGIIGATYRRDCVLIARIRNRFAHKLDIDSFDHPEIAKLCESLSEKKLLHMEGDEPMTSSPRAQFVSNIFYICGALSNGLNPNLTKKPAPAPSLPK